MRNQHTYTSTREATLPATVDVSTSRRPVDVLIWICK